VRQVTPRCSPRQQSKSGTIHPVPQAHHQPVLLLDVDGVLNPFPSTPDGYVEYSFFAGDDEPVRLNPEHARWLQHLATRFEVAWASSWGQAANELICPLFGLPAFPVVPLPPAPFDPREKVPPIAAFTRDRPAAWIDDVLTEEARLWAAERRYPTLLLEVNGSTGLTQEIVEQLLAWHHALA
jgi:HAD domain in Swiss Army Knife RNA repair proteins